VNRLTAARKDADLPPANAAQLLRGLATSAVGPLRGEVRRLARHRSECLAVGDGENMPEKDQRVSTRRLSRRAEDLPQKPVIPQEGEQGIRDILVPRQAKVTRSRPDTRRQTPHEGRLVAIELRAMTADDLAILR
jgi:hypothetical protein